MKLYLAATFSDIDALWKYRPPYVLESYQYIVPEQLRYIKTEHCKNFILDSGAFTFMNSKKNAKLDWEEYVMKYADFINKHDIKLFAELDIDSIVSLRRVEELRDLLEAETGKQPIVVWHKSRGKQDFLDTVASYPYVAIGGIVTREIKKKEYKYFPWFIRKAHEYGAKIHAMGFTNPKYILKYPFDSVDSSSWLSGRCYGTLYKFNGQGFNIISVKRKDGKATDWRLTSDFTLREWTKFARYLDRRG